MGATTITIISTIIGSVVTVTAMFILMLKFVKEPLDKRIDRLERRFDDLYQMLLAHFMDVQSKDHRGKAEGHDEDLGYLCP